MIPIPDLLHREPRATHDRQQLSELLDLAFSGGAKGAEIDGIVAAAQPRPSTWKPAFFVDDLFLTDLIEDCFGVEIDGSPFPVNRKFLLRLLSNPPTDPEEIALRQGILQEMDQNEDLVRHTERLYRRIFELTSMFRAPGDSARLDFNAYRLDILRAARQVIDSLAADFAAAASGLQRLHRAGREIQSTEEYDLLSSLLDYVERKTTLNVDIELGADAKITGMQVNRIVEARGNRFYHSALRRLWQKARMLLFYGKVVDDSELAFRLVHAVYDQISPALTSLVQISGHLEVYLAARYFRRRAESRGLGVCLADFEGGPVCYRDLFNPHLLRQDRAPVPCQVDTGATRSTTLITGPNSGGKTRFLQALGVGQLLAQNGLYTSATAARVPVLEGLFVSLVERDAVDHEEGRLGRELERIRSMFENMGSSSLVIVDELCSGTNPSEGSEIFRLVLRLLDRLRPTAYITTHFLDLAKALAAKPPVAGLEFLQVEIDERKVSTYQFLPGVAESSLADVMAARMGVTFGRLSRIIETKTGRSD